MVKLNVYIIAAVVAVIVVGGSISYYKISTNKIEALNAKLESVQTELANVSKANEIMISKQKAQAEANAKLEVALNESEQNVQNLRSLLAEHDLEFLAQNKPNLIEGRINNATKKVFDDLERITSDSQ